MAKSCAHVSLDKFRKIYIPNLERDGESEKFDAPFVYLVRGVFSLVIKSEPKMDIP